MDRPVIVCLCGSTRFTEAFHEANLRETLAGRIVLSIGCDFKSDADLLLAGKLTPADKERLDELHLRKIELADEVLFLNVGGYMGESTLREHFYAINIGKVVRYLEEPASPNPYYSQGYPLGMDIQWSCELRPVNRRTWFPNDIDSSPVCHCWNCSHLLRRE